MVIVSAVVGEYVNGGAGVVVLSLLLLLLLRSMVLESVWMLGLPRAEGRCHGELVGVAVGVVVDVEVVGGVVGGEVPGVCVVAVLGILALHGSCASVFVMLLRLVLVDGLRSVPALPVL